MRRWSVGDRVGVAWLGGACGTCARCREGRENLCSRAEFTGWDRDGGYATSMVARADFALPIPAASRTTGPRRSCVVRMLLDGDPDDVLAPYGLGEERSLDGFWRYSGLEWPSRHISSEARLGASVATEPR